MPKKAEGCSYGGYPRARIVWLGIPTLANLTTKSGATRAANQPLAGPSDLGRADRNVPQRLVGPAGIGQRPEPVVWELGNPSAVRSIRSMRLSAAPVGPVVSFTRQRATG